MRPIDDPLISRLMNVLPMCLAFCAFTRGALCPTTHLLRLKLPGRYNCTVDQIK